MPALLFPADQHPPGSDGRREPSSLLCPACWWLVRAAGAYPKHRDAKAAHCARAGCVWGPVSPVLSLPSSPLPSLGLCSIPRYFSCRLLKRGGAHMGLSTGRMRLWGCPLGGCGVQEQMGPWRCGRMGRKGPVLRRCSGTDETELESIPRVSAPPAAARWVRIAPQCPRAQLAPAVQSGLCRAVPAEGSRR